MDENVIGQVFIKHYIYFHDVNDLVCHDWTVDWAPTDLRNGDTVSAPLPFNLKAAVSPARHLGWWDDRTIWRYKTVQARLEMQSQ